VSNCSIDLEVFNHKIFSTKSSGYLLSAFMCSSFRSHCRKKVITHTKNVTFSAQQIV